MNYHWNWAIFLAQTPSGRTTYLGWLLSGLEITLSLSLSAWIIALVMGLLMGVLRTVPNRWLYAHRRGLRRSVSQYAAAGSAVYLVLRSARARADVNR